MDDDPRDDDRPDDDPIEAFREDVNRIASPIYRLLHPHARPTPAPEPRAPGQPGADDPDLSRRMVRGVDLGTVDNLRITIAASVVAVVIVTGLSRGVGGIAAPVSQAFGQNGAGFTLASVADRATKTFDLSIGAGQELEQIQVSTTSPISDGQCYVTVCRTRIVDGVIRPVNRLMASYLTFAKPMGWPGPALIESPLDGQGLRRTVSGTTPVVGGVINETVPAGALWRLETFLFIFTTSVNVATRFPLFQILDANGQSNLLIPAGLGQTASLSWNWTWGNGQGRVDQNGNVVMEAFPVELLIQPGSIIAFGVIGGMVAGDQFSVVQYVVREWLNPLV